MKAILISLCTLLFSCQVENRESDRKETVGKTMEGIRIAWDYSSMQQVDERGGYPRLLRLKDNSIFAIYETRTGNIVYKRSYDDGISWSEVTPAFSKFTYTNDKQESTLINMANPEIIQLTNGDIVLACNYRPAKEEVAPYSIVIKRSEDNGKTWFTEQILYNAEPRFRDGCWEPSFLQLPDGKLQVYFANENPYQHSDEQEISMLSSSDNGKTWTDTPKTVSFRKDRRDGMPVAAIIGDEIVVVIEDNNINQFKPYTVRTKLSDNWPTPVLNNSAQREHALSEAIPDNVYMGAPYLLKLPNGETLISYQSNENRSSDWELSTMEVAIGDQSARNFNRRSQPFNVPLDKEAKWNSLALWDENTVVAFASSNFKSADVAPWLIKGYIIPEIRIVQKEITAFPLFIGAKSQSSMRAGLGIDNEYLYLKCKVSDNTLFENESNPAKSDGVYLYIDTDDASSKKEGKGLYRIGCSYKGKVTFEEKEKDHWKTKAGGEIQATAVDTQGGYELSVAIPLKQIKEYNKKYMKLGMALSAYDSVYSGYTEWLANCEEDTPETWMRIEF